MKTHVLAQDIVGSITNPLNKYGGIEGTAGAAGGLTQFMSNILRLVFVAAGVIALLNILSAGFQFMNAGGDAKLIVEAWKKIWISLVGLVILVSSFALAALFGYLIFGDATYILNPIIVGPGQ